MSNVTFSGPVRAGTVRDNSTSNVGTAVLVQSYSSGDLTGTVVGNTDAIRFYIPAGSQIIDIIVDATTAFTTGTGTVSVGTTSGGAELMAAVAVTAGGRFRGTATAATQAAWLAVGTAGQPSASIYVRLAVGTATLGAGAYTVMILYKPVAGYYA